MVAGVRSDVFAAIADPTRREILTLLRERDLTAGEVAARFPRISRPAVSKHLRVLLAARLCRVRRAGRSRHYALDGMELRHVDAWIEGYRDIWGGKLESLRRFVEFGRAYDRSHGRSP